LTPKDSFTNEDSQVFQRFSEKTEFNSVLKNKFVDGFGYLQIIAISF